MNANVVIRFLRFLGYDARLGRLPQQREDMVVGLTVADLYHELGHALSYVGDAEPVTPVEDWSPEPRWVVAATSDEPTQDRYAQIVDYVVRADWGDNTDPLTCDDFVLIARVDPRVWERIRDKIVEFRRHCAE